VRDEHNPGTLALDESPPAQPLLAEGIPVADEGQDELTMPPAGKPGQHTGTVPSPRPDEASPSEAQSPADADEDASEEDFINWLKSEHDYTPPRRGGVHEATILSLDDSGIMVHLGDTKRDGRVPAQDLDRLDEEYRATIKEGARVPVRIIRESGPRGHILVSLSQGQQYRHWLTAEKLLLSGEVLEAEVVDHNRGGVLVSFGRLQGFVPNSQLSRGMQRNAESKAKLVGEKLTLVVIEVDQRRRRLVLSQRGASRQARAQRLEQLEEGQRVSGTVRSLVDFGAFVDLGGIDGLIHISELDWKFVEKPSEVLKVGDKVEVLVLQVDRDRQRVGLSRKQALPNPWNAVAENLFPGDHVLGTVTTIKPFGAFVDVGDGIEGLLHVSNMPRGEATRSGLQAGSSVPVRVLSIDRQRRQIELVLQEHAVA